jgi:polyadenylate-binding protein
MDLSYSLHHDPSFRGPQPHPYIQDPVLYVSNLPPYVTDESLASALTGFGPFRPKIIRDGAGSPASGSIEFKFLDKGQSSLSLSIPSRRLAMCAC